MSLFESLRKLEESGIDLVEVLGQDEHLRSPADLAVVVDQLRETGDDLYVELLHFVTYRRFSPAQAKSIWAAILKHKSRMEDKLGRPVRFRVAALDYLHGKTGLLRGVRLVARSEMDALLSYVVVDEVSTVFNRRYFNETLSSEVNRARRYGSPLTLLLLDLDNFKEVNDRYGHLEGDHVLRQVGRLLRENTRQADSVCRYGGDEFAAILPETTASEAFTLGDRIRKAIGRVIVRPPRGAVIQKSEKSEEGEEREGDDDYIVLSASIGGATFPTDCDELEDLIRLADSLCLEAKSEGKNRIKMGGERPPEPPAEFEFRNAK